MLKLNDLNCYKCIFYRETAICGVWVDTHNIEGRGCSEGKWLYRFKGTEVLINWVDYMKMRKSFSSEIEIVDWKEDEEWKTLRT